MISYLVGQYVGLFIVFLLFHNDIKNDKDTIFFLFCIPFVPTIYLIYFMLKYINDFIFKIYNKVK